MKQHDQQQQAVNLSSESSLAKEYQSEGVIALGAIASEGDVDIIQIELQYYADEVAPNLPSKFVSFDKSTKDDVEAVRNFYWLNLHSKFFEQLGEMLEIPRIIAPIVGWKPVLHNVETFMKPAQVGSAVPFHQDSAYLCISPPSAFATVWLSIDHANEANGALQFYPGSHLRGAAHHNYHEGAVDPLVLEDIPSLQDQTPSIFELQPGHATLHHADIFHGSPPNESMFPRRGVAMAFRDENAEVDVERMRMMFGFSWLDRE